MTKRFDLPDYLLGSNPSNQADGQPDRPPTTEVEELKICRTNSFKRTKML